MPPLLSSSAGPMRQRRGSGCAALHGSGVTQPRRSTGERIHPHPSLPPLLSPTHPSLSPAFISSAVPPPSPAASRFEAFIDSAESHRTPRTNWVYPSHPEADISSQLILQTCAEENRRSIKRKDLVPLTRRVSHSYAFYGLTCKEEEENPSLQGTLIMCLTMTRGLLCQ